MSMIEPVDDRPRRENGAQVFSPLQQDLVVPTDREIDTLLKILIAQYPKMVTAGDEFREAFGTALVWLCNDPGRTQALSRHYFDYWIGRCQEWSDKNRRAGLPLPTAYLDARAVFAAIVAAADVPFLPPGPGHGLNVGLTDRFAGSRASQRWRLVLSGEARLLPPLPPPPRPSGPGAKVGWV
jgi:hypothetical protein